MNTLSSVESSNQHVMKQKHAFAHISKYMAQHEPVNASVKRTANTHCA